MQDGKRVTTAYINGTMFLITHRADGSVFYTRKPQA